MSAPDFDKRMWTLVTHNQRYALLRDAKNVMRGMVAVFDDGEWEHHDQGDYDVMARAYQTLSVKAGQAIDSDPPKNNFDLEDLPTTFEQPSGPVDPIVTHPNFGRF